MRQLPFQSSYLSLLFSWQTFTVLDLMSKLITKSTWFRFVWFEFFSNDGKVGFMCSKAEHNEVSCQRTTIKTMNCEHSEKTLPQPMIKDTTVTQDTNTKKSPNKHISRGGKAKKPKTS